MTAFHRCRFETPLGPLVAVSSKRGLCGLEFLDGDRDTLLSRRVARSTAMPEYAERMDDALRATEQWLERYFSGQFSALPPVAIDWIGSEFEVAVWRALLGISLGRVATYGEIARNVRCKSARAIGMAVGRNPISILVPCHRVIGANDTLTGYGGGLDRKRFLLAHEGLVVDGCGAKSRVSMPSARDTWPRPRA